MYFGWPAAHEGDPERCVRAALEMVQAVKGVSTETRLAVRIGVATGTVVIGEAARTANADVNARTILAVGETPNLAAQLKGFAGPDEIVIEPATRRLLHDAFDLTELGTRTLKDMADPIHLWRVEGPRRTKGRFEAAREGTALTPLVGREEEVALLRRTWRQACRGEGRVVLVGGEPGIGKSRLTQVLREQIAANPTPACVINVRPITSTPRSTLSSSIWSSRRPGPERTRPPRSWTRWRRRWRALPRR